MATDRAITDTLVNEAAPGAPPLSPPPTALGEAPATHTEDALVPRIVQTAPAFMVRDPAARNIGHVCDEDRRRLVHIALDAARERLRAYRLVCSAAQSFYTQRDGFGAEFRHPKQD